jgi:hypothetical protein
MITRNRLIILCLTWFLCEPPRLFAFTPAAVLPAEAAPWAPDARCKLNPARPQGLHPDAYSALKTEAVAHRITQGINHAPERGNVHDTDVTINGKPYTGAVDISVRCLTAAQIQALLARLAAHGFAGWYRNPGRDGWSGPPHIHAVWAGSPLKAILQWQVESWLNGKNGLGSDALYQFWQPSREMTDKVRTLYRKFN